MQKFGKMKKYTGFIFAILVGFFANAATYYTVPTSSNSCADEAIIVLDIKMNANQTMGRMKVKKD
jgi:hypothetical protein